MAPWPNIIFRWKGIPIVRLREIYTGPNIKVAVIIEQVQAKQIQVQVQV